MTMPLSVEWVLVTHGEEERIVDQENMFSLSFDGYKLFPLNQTIEIKRHDNENQIGSCKIVELIFRENKTICKYQLISLYNVN